MQCKIYAQQFILTNTQFEMEWALQFIFVLYPQFVTHDHISNPWTIGYINIYMWLYKWTMCIFIKFLETTLFPLSEIYYLGWCIGLSRIIHLFHYVIGRMILPKIFYYLKLSWACIVRRRYHHMWCLYIRWRTFNSFSRW